MRVLAAFVPALLLQNALAGPVPQAPAASIQGAVIQAGAPDTVIPRATVEIRRAGDVASVAAAPLMSTVTDGEGKYYFPSLPAGEYRIAASAGGYVRTEYGQKRINGAGLPVSLAAGRPVAGADIELTPTGSISGRVTDVNGQPIVLADVFALKASYQEGQRTFVRVLSAKTDDRGEYKIFWMTPGLYYVNLVVPDGTANFALIMNADGLDTQASMNADRSTTRDVLSRPIGTGAGPNEAHVPVYFPTTTDPRQARPLEIRPGQEIRGLDITAIRVNTRAVRGTVFNAVTRQLPAGAPTQVRILPLDPAQVPLAGTVNSETGKFEIPRVVPGNYMLYAQMRPLAGTTPTNEALWTSLPLEIRDRDIEDLSLGVAPGVPLNGRISLDESAGAPVSLAGIFVGMRPDPLLGQNAPSPGTQAGPDGTFTFASVIPNRYRVYVIPMLAPNNPGLLSGLPPGPPALKDRNVYVKSIRLGGIDVLDTGALVAPGTEALGMEIVLGVNAASIDGRVIDGQKRPAAGATVGVIPAAMSARGFRMDMYKSTAADGDGRFQFAGLPPGEYKVFAFEDVDRNALIDQDFMRTFEGLGTTVGVTEGQKGAVEVLVIPAGSEGR